MSFLGLKHSAESRAKMSAALTGKKRVCSKSFMERFMEKVSPEPMSGCWLWMGAGRPIGYGNFKFGARIIGAHVASWLLSGRTIPEGLELDHKCHVPSCVNPNHLRAVTHGVNCESRDTSNCGVRGREKTHCPNGHEYTAENTRHYAADGRKNGTSGRICIACEKVWNARKRANRKVA